MHGEKAAAPPRFAVVDDHRLFASGLAHLLSQPPISAEVELFADPDSLLNGRARHAQAWDMIALDYFIPGRSPTEMIRSARKRFPTARILIVSGSLAPSDRAAALTAGADEFVGKTASFDRLVAVVSELLSKTRTDEKRVIDTPDICAIAEAVGLSTRQLEILSCAAKGLSNKEIALSLAISPETTKTHFAEIFRRLNVRNRVEAIDAARARGLG